MPLSHSLDGHPVLSGIIGTAVSAVSTAISIMSIIQGAITVIAFVTAIFGAGTAIYTFLIVRRKWREYSPNRKFK